MECAVRRMHESRGPAYARVLALRVRMRALREELGVRRGWSMAAGIIGRHFELAFVRFLDAPTTANLAAVLECEAQMRDVDRRLPTSRLDRR